MTLDASKLTMLVAVGSRHERVCSIGAFARAEVRAFRDTFKKVELLEPDEADRYPILDGVVPPDVIMFHAPALHDRKRPWNAILSAAQLRRAFPKALFVSVVHEFAEAPLHWRGRQILIAAMSDGVITNSEPDFRGMVRWSSKVNRTPLGPTLFYEELLNPGSAQARGLLLVGLRARVRDELIKAHGESLGLKSGQKWILHPGLLTPGKGVNFLGQLAPYLPSSGRLIIMGGIGPKQRDRDFAQQTLAGLREKMNDRMSFLNSPDDETYRKFLLAADLVVLPYDRGLSERRSSFLSSMCCGGNVWTTTGAFSGPLEVEFSGIHSATSELWGAEDPAAIRSISAALIETDEEILLRRVKNLAWAAPRSWQSRTRSIAQFILSLA